MGDAQKDHVKAARRHLWCYIVIASIVGVGVGVAVGILIGHFAMGSRDSDAMTAGDVTPPSAAMLNSVREADPEVAELIMNGIDNNKIRENLR
jgi:hypothetical protein